MYYYYGYPTPVGGVTIACNDENIVGLWLDGQKYDRDVLAGKAAQERETDVIRLAKAWLDRYFRGERPPIAALPIEFTGSEFRKRVWQILTEIPYGEVVTYGEIAKQIAKQQGVPSMSAQAVGGAVGHNPISIILPCHRVVGGNGSLTGYAGGVGVKIKLLAHEGVDVSKFSVPAL